MMIHTDRLTDDDVTRALRRAGVVAYRRVWRGSRSRAYKLDIILEGLGRTGTRYGQNHDMIAATWDEWGIFLDEIFRADPSATVPRIYPDRDAFHWATDGCYATLRAAEQHVRHRWSHGTPGRQDCPCGAVRRWKVPARPVPAAPRPTLTESYPERGLGRYASDGGYADDLAASPAVTGPVITEADLLTKIDDLLA